MSRQSLFHEGLLHRVADLENDRRDRTPAEGRRPGGERRYEPRAGTKTQEGGGYVPPGGAWGDLAPFQGLQEVSHVAADRFIDYDRLEETASCLEHTVNVIEGIILKKV